MDSLTPVDDQIAQLEAAIAAQEQLRPTLGAAVVDTVVSVLRAQLDRLLSTRAEDPSADARASDHSLAQLQAHIPVDLAEKARLASARRHAEGERKIVTVLFADLSGFTALSERFDPEIIRAFQDDLFREVASVVYQYEGFIEKFIGDAILALFGAPLTHEDDPERALRTALAIRDRMDVLNRRWADRLGQFLTLHLGINTGIVVAGQLGSGLASAYSVTGDTVNTAARLLEVAGPGEILVGLGTYRLTHGAFVFRPLEPITAKGKQEPVTVFALERAKMQPGKSRGLQGLASPIVGRDFELEQLRRVGTDLVAGQGAIVTISGEAGIGKSRLLPEWRAMLGQRVSWLEGHSFAHTTALAYGPFLDLLRRYAGILDEDSEARARSQLLNAVGRLFPDDVKATAIFASMLGMRLMPEEASFLGALPAEGVRRRLFALLQDLFAGLARRQPTVLAVEDLHWADSSSIELIEHLLLLTRQLPLAVVLVFRSGFTELPLQRVIKDHYGDLLTLLPLGPLPDAAGLALVQQLLSTPDLSGAVRDTIVRKADGNPFFLEEIIRSLIARGALVRQEGDQGWAATELIDVGTVPDTLQGVLMARVDRLPDETKWVVQQAAVIGRIFLYRVLLKLAENAVTLEADLTQLEREELIQELTRDPEVEYMFKHALTQEVAYESLLASHRRELHGRVGAAMEELFADRLGELQGVLGEHFLRGEVWEKAFTYLVRAGDAATRLYARPEARLHYAKALEALSHLPITRDNQRRLVDTMLKQVAVSWGTGDSDRNLAKLAEAERLAGAMPAPDGTQAPDPVQLARVHHWMGRLHYYRGEPDQAIAYFQQVLASAQELGEEQLLAIPAAIMGRALLMQGRFDQAEAMLARAMQQLEKSGDWQERVFTSEDWALTGAFLGCALAARGRYDAGLALSKRALEHAREAGDTTAVPGCLACLCFVHFLGRNAAALQETGREVARVAEEAGNTLLVYVGLAFEAWGLSQLGQPHEALQRMTEAQTTAQIAGGRVFLADWVAAIHAEIMLNAGEPERAVARTQDAVSLARAIGGTFGEGLAQRVWSQALVRLGEDWRADVEARLTQSIELFERGDCRVEVAHTQLAWGSISQENGEHAAAIDHLKRAAAEFEAAGLIQQLEQARLRIQQIATQ